jgi:hypothetical protein
MEVLPTVCTEGNERSQESAKINLGKRFVISDHQTVEGHEIVCWNALGCQVRRRLPYSIAFIWLVSSFQCLE